MQKFFKWIVCFSLLFFVPAQLTLAGESNANIPASQPTKQAMKKKSKKLTAEPAKAQKKDKIKKASTGVAGKKKKPSQQLSAKTGFVDGGRSIDGPMVNRREVPLPKEPANSSNVLTVMTTVLSFLIIPLIIVGIIMVVSGWKIFVKAGREGWESLVPILNIFRFVQIARMPLWSIAFCFLPMLNMIFPFWMSYALAKSFNKSTGFALGLTFLPFIFYPILAFGDSAYSNEYEGRFPTSGFPMAS